MALSYKKACKAKSKVLKKMKCKSLVILIKEVKIIDLQVLLPTKMGNLPLTNCHSMLSNDSVSYTLHHN